MTKPDYAVPPGALILELIAEKLGLTSLELLELFKGEALLNAKTARSLEGLVGGTFQFWFDMETAYRDDLKRLGRSL